MVSDDREPFVRGENIDLYPVERQDLSIIRNLRNMPEVRLPYGYPYTPETLEDIEAEFDRKKGETRHKFLIVHREDSKPVGQVMLVFEEEGFDTSGCAELRAFIHPDYQSNSVGTEAAFYAIDHGFNQLNLHRVWARVLETNEKSKGLCRRLGMEREGVLRDQLFIDGDYADMVYLGVLEDEWREKKPELQSYIESH